MTGKVLKIVGMVASVAGLALSVLNDYVADQKMKETVDELVTEKLAQLEKKDEEEEES